MTEPRSAEWEFNNTTATQLIVAPDHRKRYRVLSVSLYLQAGDVDDFVNVSGEFAGERTPIAQIHGQNITHTNNANVYPGILLPIGTGIWVIGIVTGAAKWAGGFVIYEEVAAAEPEFQHEPVIIPPVRLSDVLKGWGVPGV